MRILQFGTEKTYRYLIMCTLCLRYKSYISIKLETKYLKTNVRRDTQTFQEVLYLLLYSTVSNLRFGCKLIFRFKENLNKYLKSYDQMYKRCKN